MDVGQQRLGLYAEGGAAAWGKRLLDANPIEHQDDDARGVLEGNIRAVFSRGWRAGCLAAGEQQCPYDTP